MNEVLNDSDRFIVNPHILIYLLGYLIRCVVLMFKVQTVELDVDHYGVD